MLVSSVCQRALPIVSRHLTHVLKHTPKNQPPLLVRYTHSENNNVALATQEHLHQVQLGLNDKISGVETKLTKEIAGVEMRLSEKFTKEIAGVETKLTKEIAGVETKLTKEIIGVEMRLIEKIAKSHIDLSEKIGNVLTAVEKQNTGNERFKKRIYTMIGGFAATFIGYANRDRLVAMLASLKP